MNQNGKNSFLDDDFHRAPRTAPRSAPTRPTGTRPPGAPGVPRKPRKKPGLPIAALIGIDVVLAALLLLVFYLGTYVLHKEEGPSGSLPTPSWMVTASTEVSASSSSSVSTETSSQPTSSTAIVDPNDWRTKFADKFTDGEIEQTATSYRSANINVTINKVQTETLSYFVADIYVAEMKYLRTAFAEKSDTMGYTGLTTTVAQENNAIIAINGDFALNNHATGVIIRNGQPYKEHKPSADQFVLYYDGTMESIPPEEFDYDAVVARGVYQVWSWGPMLLHDGQPMTEFNMPDQFGAANPRTAIGYYEPGHYCFVVVEGRQVDTEGAKLSELSQIFYELGCTEAYNLDGGRTSEMAFFGELVNRPLSDGRRECSDIIYIGE